MGMLAPVELIHKIITLLETSTLDRRIKSLNRKNILMHHLQVMLAVIAADMQALSI